MAEPYTLGVTLDRRCAGVTTSTLEAFDPAVMMSVSDNPALADGASDARDRLAALASHTTADPKD